MQNEHKEQENNTETGGRLERLVIRHYHPAGTYGYPACGVDDVGYHSPDADAVTCKRCKRTKIFANYAA